MGEDETDVSTYYYVVRVDTDTLEHADQVMSERLGHDEDYGFGYTVDWAAQPENPSE